MSQPSPAVPRGPVSGRVVVIVFLLLMGLALFFGFAIWLAARTPWRSNTSALSRPGMSREDVAGQALVQVLHTCITEASLPDPVHVRLRVNVLPTGEAKFDTVDLNLANGTLAPCSRRAATLIRTAPAAPGGPVVSLEVRFDSALEADGTRVTRTHWVVAPAP